MEKNKYDKWLTNDGLTMLEAWARDGLSDAQTAKNCGVAKETLCRWKSKYPEIGEALARGKVVIDIEVENALLKRAKGYEYEETKVESHIIGEGEGARVIERRITKTKKHQPADVASAFIWLKNRKPDVWRDKPVVENRKIMEKLDRVIGGIDVIADK